MLSAPGKEAAASALAGIARANDSERCRELQRYEAVWKGLRYEMEARPSWWDPTVPLRERAPCVVYPIAKSAGKRLISLVMGEGRFPKIAPDASLPLTEQQGAALSTFLTALLKRSKLRLHMRAALEQGLAVGSACILLALRRGIPCVEVIPAKWCTPVLDELGEVESLEIKYKVSGPGGVLCWYRRTITQSADTEYELVPVEEKVVPVWVQKTSIPLPLCPVVWVRSMPDPGDDGVDGVPFFAGLEDEIEALDFALSQRHRNAQYNGEPLTVKILGEDNEDSAPAPTGRVAQAFSWANSVAREAFAPTLPAIKKGPGQVITLTKGGDMKLVESSGAGAQILDGDAMALRRMILETLGVVMADPETIAANASAALQKQLYAPMLATADDLRETWGDVLTAVLNKLLALCAAVDPTQNSVRVTGFAAAYPILRALWTAQGWSELPLSLTWGEYFDPTAQDVQSAATAATAANGGRPVLSHRASVRYVAKLVGTEDIDAEIEEIARDEAGGLDAVSKVLGPARTDTG